MAMTSQFFDMTSSSNLFDVVLFFLPSLVTGPSFMSIWSLVLDLWRFFFIMDWLEIQKSEIPRLCLPNIWRLGEQEISNSAQTSLIKYYWVLENARVTAFTVCELLRENQREGGKPTPFPSPQIRVNCSVKMF